MDHQPHNASSHSTMETQIKVAIKANVITKYFTIITSIHFSAGFTKSGGMFDTID